MAKNISPMTLGTVPLGMNYGMANAAAAAIDAMKIDDVVGTLAGDDTIFILLKEVHEAVELTEAVRSMLK